MNCKPSRRPPYTPCLRVVLLLVLFLLPCLAWAQASTTGPLPYEAGLENLVRSLSGPVPFAISLVGIVACGAMLIFGGEISGFMRTLVFLVLVIAIIVQATSVVELMGGKWKGSAPTKTQVSALRFESVA